MQGRQGSILEEDLRKAMSRCSSLSKPSWGDIVLEVGKLQWHTHAQNIELCTLQPLKGGAAGM